MPIYATPVDALRAARRYFETAERFGYDPTDDDGETLAVGACVYRGPEGVRCAVGCLIPDDMYDPAWEGMKVADLPPWLIRELGGDADVLHRLQYAHDEIAPESFGVLTDDARAGVLGEIDALIEATVSRIAEETSGV